MIVQKMTQDASLYVMRTERPKTGGDYMIVMKILNDRGTTIPAYDMMTEIVVDAREIRDDGLGAARPER